jgi:hypothetical protein
MLAHILLVLAFRSAMPNRLDRTLKYPGEKTDTDASSPGSGAAVYQGYLADLPNLSERLHRPANDEIR